ncbi:ComZ family protein [Halalkalibacter hemicellulosilyticus]|uniref:Possible repressor of comG operon n=1 Tax=Halalkalibacter hemicellulosilyticusJCM 9152 TaxID=1236971 RepID=W4QHT7_9BACI|nr:ComZ family protein [Halalkalibacter hemicellulosilyticus]GAE31218.1 possible repressor of comG operon [Halalkalibacter hemicellulosilyticusJCM 9152]
MQEQNMKFMQIAMKYLPEGKQMLDEKGIEFNMEDLQPMLELLLNVMNEAYELGKQEAAQTDE